MAGNQINFSQADIARIQSKVGSSIDGKYSNAYREVLVINDERRAAGQPTLDSKTEFWFKNAADINGDNPNSSSNLYIRTVTANGLAWDGKSASGMQDISNKIGDAVILELKNGGGVPDINTLIRQDITGALRDGGQTIGGWGGSFYYWNAPYGGTTVGEYIRNNPAEYEKFLAVNGKAASDTLGFNVRTKGAVEAYREAGVTGLSADAPINVEAAIWERVKKGERTDNFAGDPDYVLGFTRNTNGVWTLDGRPTYLSSETIALLEQTRSLRLELQIKGALKSLGGDPQNEAIGIDADGLQYRNAAGEVESVQIKTSVFSANDIQVMVKKSGRLVASELDTKNANGTLTKKTDNNGDGTFDKVREYRADGTIEVIRGQDASGNIFTEGFDALGTLASYVFKKPDGSQLSFSGDQLGGILGSSIGNAIGGKNFATKVVATTLIGSLGQTIGGLLNIQGNAGKSLIAQVNGASTLDSAFSSAVSSFGKAVPINLLNNVTGGVSSMLMGELANSLGLKGFAAGAFTTVGTTFTTQNAANDNGLIKAKKCG